MIENTALVQRLESSQVECRRTNATAGEADPDETMFMVWVFVSSRLEHALRKRLGYTWSQRFSISSNSVREDLLEREPCGRFDCGGSFFGSFQSIVLSPSANAFSRS